MNIFTADKILYHGDRLRSWLQGGNPPPITCELDLIGACNSRCPRCVGGEREGRLSVTRAKSLIEELAAFGIRGLCFTGGGEPSLHTELGELMIFARLAGLSVALITNGVCLHKDQIQAAVDSCTWIRVSLDAGSAEGYARTHGGNPETFRKVLRNTAALAAMRNDKRSRVTIGVGMLVDDSTIPEMVPATQLVKATGADYIQFRPFYVGFFGGPDKINIEAYQSAALISKREETEIFNVLSSVDKFQKLAANSLARAYPRCHGQQFCAVITATGDVTLCCLTRGKQRFTFGNILVDSFKNIWESSWRQEVMAELDMSIDCPALCRCDKINDCLDAMAKNKPMHEDFL